MLWADPGAGYRLSRSRGWSGEAAALDAARLLDTHLDSAAVSDLAGFFSLGAGTVAVVRGGLVAAPDGTDRYWREVIAIDRTDFERLRCNPFRILPCIPRAVERPSRANLPAAELPPDVGLDEELRRLGELLDGLPADDALDRETLVAAVLHGEHTLVASPDPGAAGLELLLLLLPAPLRADLTFHSHALSTPAPPLPRLVVAGAGAAAASFEGTRWTHRLPEGRGAIAPRARRVAGDLLALLGTPDRLVETHHAFEEYLERVRPPRRPIIDEIETVLRFARLRRCTQAGNLAGAAAAVHLVGEALAAHNDAGHPEPDRIFETARTGFPPDLLGAAVAASFPEGAPAAAASAFMMERFALRRDADPAAFSEFTRPIEQSAAGGVPGTDDESARRLRTLLMLLAAARGDAAGLVASLTVPPDADLVERLGGVKVWASAAGGPLADALRAFVGANSIAGAGAALDALGSLVPELTAGRDRLRIADLALDFTRHALARLPEERWQEATTLALGALQLCQAVSSASRMSLDGRPDSEHFHELLSRSMNPAARMDLSSHSDAEVFFGFLGADSSRSRLARREVDTRGGLLVRALAERIRRKPAEADRVAGAAAGAADAGVVGPAAASGGDTATPSAEGIHWSFALLERVRRAELDAQYVPLAIGLLAVSAGAATGRSLRAYFETHPEIAPALFDHARPQDFLDVVEFTALCAAALSATLDQAKTSRDTGATVTLCQRFRAASVLLLPADVRRAVEAPLRALVAELRENSARPIAMHVSALTRALTPIVSADALPILQAILQVHHAGAPPRAYGSTAASARAAQPVRAPSRAVRIAGVLGVAVLSMIVVLLSSDIGRRALFDGSSAGVMGGAAPAGQLPRPLDPESRLGGARDAAAAEDWEEVVGLLTGDVLVRGDPAAFAWDSLLAWGALRRARSLQAQDARRREHFGLARDRASRGLVTGPPTTTAGDLLRLIRAEACLTSNLECEDATILVDLALAAESADRAIAQRAGELVRLRW